MLVSSAPFPTPNLHLPDFLKCQRRPSSLMVLLPPGKFSLHGFLPGECPLPSSTLMRFFRWGSNCCLPFTRCLIFRAPISLPLFQLVSSFSLLCCCSLLIISLIFTGLSPPWLKSPHCLRYFKTSSPPLQSRLPFPS